MVVVITVIALLANVLNIIVLSQKDMMKLATSRILVGITVANVSCLLSNLIYAWILYLRPDRTHRQYYTSYGLAVIFIWSVYFFNISHLISNWFVLMLALGRYFSVARPFKYKFWSSILFSWKTILGGFIVIPIVYSPIMTSVRIEPDEHLVLPNGDPVFEVSLASSSLYVVFGHMLNRLLPAVLVTVLMFR